MRIGGLSQELLGPGYRHLLFLEVLSVKNNQRTVPPYFDTWIPSVKLIGHMGEWVGSSMMSNSWQCMSVLPEQKWDHRDVDIWMRVMNARGGVYSVFLGQLSFLKSTSSTGSGTTMANRKGLFWAFNDALHCSGVTPCDAMFQEAKFRSKVVG